MDTIHELDFGTFRFSDQYIIGQPNADAHMGAEVVSYLADLARDHYKAPFYYVGNRINQNSVDPLVVDRISSEVPLLTGIAIVYYHTSTRQLLELEKVMVKTVPFEAFSSIAAAHTWGSALLRQKTTRKRVE